MIASRSGHLAATRAFLLLALLTLVIVLAAKFGRESVIRSSSSVTVKLPAARPAHARPGFAFGPARPPSKTGRPARPSD